MTVSDSGSESKELTDVLSVSRIAVYPVDTYGLVVGPGFRAASRRDAGHARRTRGIPGFDNHANMDEIAEQTGGKAYYNTNDFTRVIGDVARTSSSYYTMAYAPPTQNGTANSAISKSP